jgi:hypothetical protein
MQKVSIGWLIAFALLAFMFLDFLCWRPKPYEPGPPTVTRDTFYIKGDSFPVPYPVIEISDPDTIEVPTHLPINIDTLALITDYFSKVSGRDTLANDSSVLVIIDWMVTQNRLKEVTPFIQNRKMTAIVYETSTYPQAPKRIYGIGGGIGVPEGWYLSASFEPKRIRYRGSYLRLQDKNYFLVGAEFTF